MEEYSVYSQIENLEKKTPLMIVAERKGYEKIALLLSHYEKQQSRGLLSKRPREEQGATEPKRQKEALSNIN